MFVVGKRTKTISVEQLDDWWARLFKVGFKNQPDPWPSDDLQKVFDEMHEGLDLRPKGAA